jgi:hypothetical protein
MRRFARRTTVVAYERGERAMCRAPGRAQEVDPRRAVGEDQRRRGESVRGIPPGLGRGRQRPAASLGGGTGLTDPGGCQAMIDGAHEPRLRAASAPPVLFVIALTPSR